MRNTLLCHSTLLFALLATPAAASAHSHDVTIMRDTWGIAHVQGKTDADAVFGAIYAQAEDDFPRVEANLLTALGRLAEAKGEDAVWQDLRQRLWIDHAALKRDYAASPAWLRKLMDAWAEGLNHYLATHPEEKPLVLKHFEPWMALSFTEGSIGGDIESVDLALLAQFHGGAASAKALALAKVRDDEPRGSNGLAIAPKLSASGNALLLINPHTSLFFRSELGMESKEGLHAYGASTWGQFFIYQGFNEHLGWMHTSSGADNIDEFSEKVERRGDKWFYWHANVWKPVTEKAITLQVRQPDGTLAERTFTTYSTHHGPVVRTEGDRWISVALMNTPIAALSQSWLRTKAKSQQDYLKALDFNANSSNNTLYADRDGNIAFLMPEFAPRRSAKFDYRDPVDGSDPAADWQGIYARKETPHVINPASGWAYNANDAPWRAAGEGTFDSGQWPATFDTFGPNPRGDHMMDLLGKAKGLTLESLHALAYDPHMPLFDDLIPGLAVPAADDALSGPVALLKGWDRRWIEESEAMSLAHYWADDLQTTVRAKMPKHANAFAEIRKTSPEERAAALQRATAKLTADFGTWKVPWGQVNRYQRVTSDIVQPFADDKPSLPVVFGSARWGSLASFGTKQYPGTKRWYGTSGNSFVAVVEFGPRVKAYAVSSGGASGREKSPHFNDQAALYAAGKLREVYFYLNDTKMHLERTYKP
ncbi:MAG: acylase [Novosphingobium sp. 28-62-57]|uniref:penicillin acylase family protein n=1 Tax=unclassified Novosphingobium TaxID=2644732 RepID=UPI000BD081DA|nr:MULTISPECIES: penicillin acylase family protein [unclassified Novosphingobium]OYW49006.1 MAG: acylase [Novosphingobium sp. 12-62-10]OYZ09526.1 MAG: acylase [Novosphingobium sp. 28-62-57]HQS69951.1 penicillin acylase family protein [Novosphingobium sp.]